MSDAGQVGQPACGSAPILSVAQLPARSAQECDHSAEGRALAMLLRVVFTEPGSLAQKLIDEAMTLCRASAAGISVLERGEEGDVIRWHAVSGSLARHGGRAFPRHASPCGLVIDRNAALLFRDAPRRVPGLKDIAPALRQMLLVPWERDGRRIGTLWVMTDRDDRGFDAEDARLLQNLARVASLAHRTMLTADRADATRERSGYREGRRGSGRGQETDAAHAAGENACRHPGQDAHARSRPPPAERRRLDYVPDPIGVENGRLRRALQATQTELARRHISAHDARRRFAVWTAELARRAAREAMAHEASLALIHRMQVAAEGLEESNTELARANALLEQRTSELSRANAALVQNEEQLRTLVTTLDLGSFMARDLGGTIRHWSGGCERLYGWSSAEVLGRSAHELLHTVFPVPQAEIGAALEQTGEWKGDVQQRARDGRQLVVAMHKLLQRARDGRPVGVVEAMTDATARQQAELAQRESETRLRELQAEMARVSRVSTAGEFASALAHELNQPLAAITTSLRGALRIIQAQEAMRGGAGPAPAIPPRALEALERAVGQAMRAAQILRKLREVVVRGETERQPEHLPGLIRETADLAVIGVRGRGTRVTLRIAPRLPAVFVDRIQIQQVLLNLMRNAVEAMADRVVAGAEGGEAQRSELSVSARMREPQTVEVAVADTGPGLAPEVAERLFEPFVSTKPDGMGVGLSISRTIINAHGGRIWAEASPSGGTVFRFTLPTTTAHGEIS